MHFIIKCIARLSYFRKWHNCRLVILLGIFITFILIYRLLSYNRSLKIPGVYIQWRDKDFHLTVDRREIIILRWTSYWNTQYDPVILTNETCPHVKLSPEGELFKLPCRITFDRRYLEKSDALIFHSYDLISEKVPSKRILDQPWIYLQQECPTYTLLNLKKYANVFNWTMTYRRDSDIYHPYGHTVPLSQPITVDLNSIQAKNRPKLVAWIVSSCDSESKREYFVEELKKYVNVSVYGWCGQDCPSGDCYAHVAKTHKFYLSFENALCKDYITEKFFYALLNNVVPVVYGGASLDDYSAVAPEGSYIDARNFKSTKELAEYLLYLDRNHSAYLKYFEWKTKYKVMGAGYSKFGWCNLCQRVYEHLQFLQSPSSTDTKNRKQKSKYYKDLWLWWNYITYGSELEQEREQGELSLAIVGESYDFKLATPACKPSIKNLTGLENKVLDFEPTILNGRLISKLMNGQKRF